jgi:hypothetical protein
MGGGRRSFGSLTFQSPLDIVGLLIRQDDRSRRRERALNQLVFTIPKRVFSLLPILGGLCASFI